MKIKVEMLAAKITLINYRSAYERLDLIAGNECLNYMSLRTLIASSKCSGWVECNSNLYEFIVKWAGTTQGEE